MTPIVRAGWRSRPGRVNRPPIAGFQLDPAIVPLRRERKARDGAERTEVDHVREAGIRSLDVQADPERHAVVQLERQRGVEVEYREFGLRGVVARDPGLAVVGPQPVRGVEPQTAPNAIIDPLDNLQWDWG